MYVHLHVHIYVYESCDRNHVTSIWIKCIRIAKWFSIEIVQLNNSSSQPGNCLTFTIILYCSIYKFSIIASH